MEPLNNDTLDTIQRLETVLPEIVGMLREVTGEDESWGDRITAATRLEDDLLLESIDLAALGELMRERYGDGVDLPAHLAALDLDGIIALRVADLIALAQWRDQ